MAMNFGYFFHSGLCRKRYNFFSSYFHLEVVVTKTTTPMRIEGGTFRSAGRFCSIHFRCRSSSIISNAYHNSRVVSKWLSDPRKMTSDIRICCGLARVASAALCPLWHLHKGPENPLGKTWQSWNERSLQKYCSRKQGNLSQIKAWSKHTLQDSFLSVNSESC